MIYDDFSDWCYCIDSLVDNGWVYEYYFLVVGVVGVIVVILVDVVCFGYVFFKGKLVSVKFLEFM